MHKTQIMVTTAIILDNRRKTEKNIYHIKIRVTSNRVQKYYQITFHSSPEEFASVMRPNSAKKLKEIKAQLDHLELKAKK